MPRGYHIVIEIAGTQFASKAIETKASADQTFNALCDEGLDHVWLIEGSPSNPGPVIGEFTRVIIKMGIRNEDIVKVVMSNGAIGPTKYRVENVDHEKGRALIQEIRHDGERAPAVPITYDIGLLVKDDAA